MDILKKYCSFLSSPYQSNILSPDAVLAYIPTLVTIRSSQAIDRHFSAQSKLLKKLNERVIHSIVGDRQLCAVFETIIEFTSGGGAFLTGLDDNFLSGRKTTFPIIHTVRFDERDCICDIRLFWDQGSLLKLMDVIGSCGRSWPIRAGQEQISLIENLTKSSQVSGYKSNDRDDTSNGRDESDSDHDKTQPGTMHAFSSSRVTRDPHASLSLFEPIREPVRDRSRLACPTVEPRKSARPPPRDLETILAGSDISKDANRKSLVGSYPSTILNKQTLRAGAGKHYYPNRLFDCSEEGDINSKRKECSTKKIDPIKYKHFEFEDSENGGGIVKEPDSKTRNFPKSIKPDNRRYSHFEFIDIYDEKVPTKNSPVRPRRSANHENQWDFADFSTPQPVKLRVRDHDVRHFGWSDDEGENIKTPVLKPMVHKPRPDTESHFSFHDSDEKTADSNLEKQVDHNQTTNEPWLPDVSSMSHIAPTSSVNVSVYNRTNGMSTPSRSPISSLSSSVAGENGSQNGHTSNQTSATTSPACSVPSLAEGVAGLNLCPDGILEENSHLSPFDDESRGRPSKRIPHGDHMMPETDRKLSARIGTRPKSMTTPGLYYDRIIGEPDIEVNSSERNALYSSEINPPKTPLANVTERSNNTHRFSLIPGSTGKDLGFGITGLNGNRSFASGFGGGIGMD